MAVHQRQDHHRIFAALAFVHAHRERRGQRVQLRPVIGNVPLGIADQHHLVVHVGDAADVAVEHALVIIVARLHHLVADPENLAGHRQFALAARRRIQRLLQEFVQVFHAAGQSVHRRQHLHVAADIHALAGQFVPAQLDHQGRRRFIVGDLPQLELPRAAHVREPAAIDAVGVKNDRALPRLAENLGQPHHRRRFRPDDILQHRPRAHRRQLVDVADQHHPAAVRRRPQQIIHQQNVHHRYFVDNDHIGIDRVLLAPAEHRPAAALRAGGLQQPVDGQRFPPRCFRQTFGRPAGRRRQGDFAALHRQYVQHRLDRGRFAGTRPPGHHQYAVAAGRPHRLPLRFGQLDSPFPFELSRQRRHIRLTQAFRRVTQPQQTFRHLAFGVVQMVRINQRPGRRILHRQRSLPQQL